MSENQIIIKEKQVDTILTKSNLPIAGYSINTYVGCIFGCKYCYADFMKRFTNHSEPWGTFLDIKYWRPILYPKKYSGKTMILGSVTDCYNYLEKKYERTREFLKQMAGSGINLIITTKSDLVLRDLDLIKTYNDPLVSLSLNTLDEEFKNDMDKAVSIKRRIEALKILHKNNIRTTCFISPIFPEITNVFDIIEEVKDYTDYIWLENLNLRGSYKPKILNYIKEKYPDLVDLYDNIYNKNDNSYWEDLNNKVSDYANKFGFMYVEDKDPFLINKTDKPIIINYFYHEKITQKAKKQKN